MYNFALTSDEMGLVFTSLCNMRDKLARDKSTAGQAAKLSALMSNLSRQFSSQVEV